MKLLLGLLLLAVATHASPRIIGGSDAPNGKYPYQVSLRGPRHFCGGSILNERWILTAAHCVVGHSGSSVTVVAGTNLINGGQEQSYQSSYVVWHEKYDGSKYVNDVGLIRVDRDIAFNDVVQPLPIAGEDFTKDNYPATLTGWGSTRLGGATPNNLQEIALKVISASKCKSEWYVEITESHICTLTKAGEGACHGDSGGPLVADGILIGIVSFGQPCAKGKPDVFTRVYTFVNWMHEKMSHF